MVDEPLHLTSYVDAFAAAFGTRAIAVAASQRDLGSGMVRERWSQIVHALESQAVVVCKASMTAHQLQLRETGQRAESSHLLA